MRGTIPDAVADARASIEAGQTSERALVGGLHARLIDALLAAGDVEGAQDGLVESGFGEAIPEIGSSFRCWCAAGGSGSRTAGQAAIDDMLAVQRTLSRFGATNSAVARWASIAAVGLAQVGRARGERADRRRARRRAAVRGARDVGVALRAAGVVEGGHAGVELLREAVVRLGRSPERLEHAHGLAELGAALRRAEPPRGPAAAPAGVDLADRCGGEGVADQARAELVITGARPRRERGSGVAGADAE